MENAQLNKRLAEMRSEARRERIRLKDIEKRMALMQVQGRSAQEAAQPSTSSEREERPDLPVEVRSAAPLESEDDLPDDYQIVGLDSEGVEIVYVGEAASDDVVKIPAGKYDLSGNDDAPMLAAARHSPPSRGRRNLEPVPRVSDSLSVTRNVPTIDSQLRQARKPVTRARERNFDDPRAEYRRYYEALRAGNHSYAVTGFRNFVERFPNHDYADNAQYWLGEAFYDQKRYKSALVEFRKVVDDHPRGNKVPDALLKLGYCYSQIGEIDKARQVLEQVTSLYPKSDPAALAVKKLSELED